MPVHWLADRSLREKEKFEITLHLYGTLGPGEDEDVQTMALCFKSDEIVEGIQGKVVLKVTVA